MDRNAREPSFAFARQFDMLSRKVETLRARSLLGAGLSAYLDDLTQSTFTPTTLLYVYAPSGRWTIDIESTPSNTVGANDEVWHISASIATTEGAEIPTAFNIQPHARLYAPATLTGKTFGATITSRGWIDSDVEFRVSLDAWVENPAMTAGYSTMRWSENKLFLTPR